jgi:hypothetical protein
MQQGALVLLSRKEQHSCDWAGGERPTASVLRVEHWTPMRMCAAYQRLPKGALSVQRAAKTLRSLRALPPRLVDGCSPPWRLWRTYTPQPHECMARARPNLEHRAGEARQAPVAVSRMATASVNMVEFVHRCSRRSPAHQLRTAAEQDLLTALSARLVFAQTNA